MDNNVNLKNDGEKICGFSESNWNEAFPGLSRNYFKNIDQYCKKTNKDQVALKKEVMELSIEVARQIHSIGVENWLATTESEKSLPLEKFFEDGFKPIPNELEEGKNLTPMADLVENFIVSRQSV